MDALFLTEHPISLSPLARANDDNKELTDRFQLVINGAEIINAYSELVDPQEQERRLIEQAELKSNGDDEAMMMDKDYISAMEYGMPPISGWGVGIDRLTQILTNAQNIKDCVMFPLMKPEDYDNKTVNVTKTISKPVEKIDFSNVKIEPLFEETVDFDTFSKSDFRAVKVKECIAVPKSNKLLQFTLDDGTGTDRTILSGIHAYYEPEELVGKTLIAITNLPPKKMMGIESCGMLLSAVNNLKDSEEEELHLIMIDEHIPAGAKLY